MRRCGCLLWRVFVAAALLLLCSPGCSRQACQLRLRCCTARTAALAATWLQVWDPERVVIIPDHYIFTSDPRANRNVDILREVAGKYGIKYFYDIQVGRGGGGRGQLRGCAERRGAAAHHGRR